MKLLISLFIGLSIICLIGPTLAGRGHGAGTRNSRWSSRSSFRSSGSGRRSHSSEERGGHTSGSAKANVKLSGLGSGGFTGGISDLNLQQFTGHFANMKTDSASSSRRTGASRSGGARGHASGHHSGSAEFSGSGSGHRHMSSSGSGHGHFSESGSHQHGMAEDISFSGTGSGHYGGHASHSGSGSGHYSGSGGFSGSGSGHHGMSMSGSGHRSSGFGSGHYSGSYSGGGRHSGSRQHSWSGGGSFSGRGSGHGSMSGMGSMSGGQSGRSISGTVNRKFPGSVGSISKTRNITSTGQWRPRPGPLPSFAGVESLGMSQRHPHPEPEPANNPCSSSPCKVNERCVYVGADNFKCNAYKNFCGRHAKIVMDGKNLQTCANCTGDNQFCHPKKNVDACCERLDHTVKFTFEKRPTEACRQGDVLGTVFGKTTVAFTKAADVKLPATRDMNSAHFMAIFVQKRQRFNLGGNDMEGADDLVQNRIQCHKPKRNACLLKNGLIDLFDCKDRTCKVDLSTVSLQCDAKDQQLPVGKAEILFTADPLGTRSGNCSSTWIDVNIEAPNKSVAVEDVCHVVPDADLFGYGAFIKHGKHLIHYDPVSRDKPVYRPVKHGREFEMVRRLWLLRKMLHMRLQADTSYDCDRFNNKHLSIADKNQTSRTADESADTENLFNDKLRELSATDEEYTTRKRNMTFYILAAKQCNRDPGFANVTRHMSCAYQKSLANFLSKHFKSESRRGQKRRPQVLETAADTRKPDIRVDLPTPSRYDLCVQNLAREFIARHPLRDRKQHWKHHTPKFERLTHRWSGKALGRRGKRHAQGHGRGSYRRNGYRGSMEVSAPSFGRGYGWRMNKAYGHAFDRNGQCSRKAMKILGNVMQAGVEPSCADKIPQFYWQVHKGGIYQGLQMSPGKFLWLKRAACSCNSCNAVPPTPVNNFGMGKVPHGPPPTPFGPPIKPGTDFKEFKRKLGGMRGKVVRPIDRARNNTQVRLGRLRKVREKLNVTNTAQIDLTGVTQLLTDLLGSGTVDLTGGPIGELYGGAGAGLGDLGDLVEGELATTTSQVWGEIQSVINGAPNMGIDMGGDLIEGGAAILGQLLGEVDTSVGNTVNHNTTSSGLNSVLNMIGRWTAGGGANVDATQLSQVRRRLDDAIIECEREDRALGQQRQKFGAWFDNAGDEIYAETKIQSGNMTPADFGISIANMFTSGFNGQFTHVFENFNVSEVGGFLEEEIEDDIDTDDEDYDGYSHGTWSWRATGHESDSIHEEDGSHENHYETGYSGHGSGHASGDVSDGMHTHSSGRDGHSAHGSWHYSGSASGSPSKDLAQLTGAVSDALGSISGGSSSKSGMRVQQQHEIAGSGHVSAHGSGHNHADDGAQSDGIFSKLSKWFG